MSIRRGDIAICSRGCVGLITADMPKWITYKKCDYCIGAISGADIDGACKCETGYAFVGVHLTNKIAAIGAPWSSRNPCVVGHIDQFIPEFTGHICTGTYKTFAKEHCPYCKG